MNEIWSKTLTLIGLSIYIYIFMEWVFFATKPSFMSSMNFVQKMTVFFVSSFIFVVPALLLAGTAIILSRQINFFNWIVVAIPALVFTLLVLILLDNFTYTVFKFGIVTSQGIWRGIYAVGFLVTFIFLYRNISIYMQRHLNDAAGLLNYLGLYLFVISTLTFIVNLPMFNLPPANIDSSAKQNSTMPNIILLGWDGVNATNMSTYGYERDTTPNLTKLSTNALFVENAFSNAEKTGGSLTSLLTGKPATETRVVFPPDILLGEDAYQHLPGILRQLGYSTIQVTMPYYGDAYQRNVQDGFDIVNFRSIQTNPLISQIARLGGGSSFYFAGQIILRIMERIEHIFFIKTMINPYTAVTQQVYEIHDSQRLDAMINYLNETNEPLFLHVHMMDTHGYRFYVPKQVFSAGQTQDKDWMPDFYDDAILNSDHYLNELFNYLTESGKLENTIVILYSDHGIQWDPLQRVPLLFWFPNGQYAGTIRNNVQLLDIAPTILDYLEVSPPSWMNGRSILTNDLPPARMIFSANVVSELVLTEDRRTWIIDESKISAPFYQLGKVNLIVCDKWFSLDLEHPKLVYGDVSGSTVSCQQNDIPSPDQAKELILQHLLDESYDVSGFPAEIPMETVQK